MKTDAITQMLLSLRPADADCVDQWFSSAQRDSLLREITSTRRPDRRVLPSERRVPKRRLLVAAAGAVAVAVLAVTALTQGSMQQPRPTRPAVTFQTVSSSEIVATVTNPFAAQKQLNSEFRAHGLDITVKLVAVSPSLVGTDVFISGPGGNQFEPLQRGACTTSNGGCAVGVQIASGFTGSGYIVLGRPAKPGETYVSTASSFAPGEALHCSGLYGATVRGAASVLRARGLTVTDWRADNQPVSTAPASNYIWGVDPVSANTVQVWTKTAPPPHTAYSRAWNAGCHDAS